MSQRGARLLAILDERARAADVQWEIGYWPGKGGYTVMVGLAGYVDDDDEATVYPDLGNAVVAGLRLLHEVEAGL